jgi:hypothetical protein
LSLLKAIAKSKGKIISLSIRAITVWEAIQKRSHEPIYKTYTNIEAKGLRATTFGRAITKVGAIEKRSILLSQYETYPISHFNISYCEVI